jgi:putative ABC transport system permease protein
VVVSRATAERLWPAADPLGRVIELMPQDRFDGVHAGSYEVVGVVDDIVSGWFVGGQDASAVYFPGTIGERGVTTVMLRVRDASHATLESIRLACARTLPEQNCELMPLTSAFQFQRMPFVVASNVTAALGWTALAISCLGLYGLVSYLVLQKRREIGVRLALGASSGRVARQMLGQAGRQIGLGLLIGWPLAFGVSLLIASLTDKLSSFDLVSFGLVPLGLALLALLAAWIPARRTALILPTEALRDQ